MYKIYRINGVGVKSDAVFLCHRKLHPMTQKTLRGMRTRAKKKHVASDRARRENVPKHILFRQDYNFL